MNGRTLALTTALLLAAAPHAARAQLQGTLFTSPEQRSYLDALREQYLARNREGGFDVEDISIPALPEPEAAPPPEAVMYRLGGIMSRRDGSHSIWLNGSSLSENALPDGASLVRESGTLALRFETPRGVAFLRPGQTLNFDRGVVLESYETASEGAEPQAAAAAPESAAIDVDNNNVLE